MMVGVGGTEPTMASLMTALDEDEELDCSLGEVYAPLEGKLIFLAKGDNKKFIALLLLSSTMR
jgi:hypothetical protein